MSGFLKNFRNYVRNAPPRSVNRAKAKTNALPNAERRCILMKKRIFALTVLMLLLTLPISVQAAQPWAINNRPTLSFSRTTASCYVDCKGANTKDKISATLTLNQGSTYVDSWSGSGTGSVFVSGQHAVKSGKKYTLTLSYSVNGVAKPSVSVTNTCP